MKGVLCLITVLGLLGLSSGLEAQDSNTLGLPPGEVIVTGTADDSLPTRDDKVNAARASAYKRALEEVAPVLVDSRAMANMHTLVSNYQYSEVQGFIEKATALDDGISNGGVFLQRYRIKVNTGDFNLELIKKKVDVKIVYDQVSRPSICLALDRESNDITQQYFHSKNTDFKFFEVSLPGASPRDDAAYVDEARKYSFDVIVLGETRTVEQQERKRAFTGDSIVLAVSAGPPPLVHVSWRAINVHTRAIICSVTMARKDNPFLQNTNKFRTVRGEAAAELFRELMSAWNLASRDKSILFSFENYGQADSKDIAAKLATIPGLNRNSIKAGRFTQEKMEFSAAASVTLAEINSALARVFTDQYRVVSANPDRVDLSLVGAPPTITVTINGVSLSELREIESRLRTFDGIRGFKRINYDQNTVRLSVESFKSSEDLGLFLEEALKPRLKTRSLQERSLEMSF